MRVKRLVIVTVISLGMVAGLFVHVDAAGIFKKKKNDSLHKAARAGEIRKVKKITAKLEKKGIDAKNSSLSSLKSDLYTPLMIAAFRGYTDIVNTLLEEGSRVDVRNKQGETALMWAVKGQRVAVVKRLIECDNSGVNFENNQGCTPLMYAASDGNVEIVRCLLEAGADVNAKNYRGETALMWASSNGKVQAVKVLCIHDARIDDVDNCGTTGLMRAAYNGREEVVKTLINAGASIDLKNNDSLSAAELAHNRGHIELARWMSDQPNLNSIL